VNKKTERSYRKILRNRKARIERRLARREDSDQPKPILAGGNIQYEMGEKAQGLETHVWKRLKRKPPYTVKTQARG